MLFCWLETQKTTPAHVHLKSDTCTLHLSTCRDVLSSHLRQRRWLQKPARLSSLAQMRHLQCAGDVRTPGSGPATGVTGGKGKRRAASTLGKQRPSRLKRHRQVSTIVFMAASYRYVPSGQFTTQRACDLIPSLA